MRRKHISNFQYDRHEIERALFFLSSALQESGHNIKPVFLHSIQVAEMLWERDFPQDIVIAAILHDVVEDTDVTIEEIKRKFGQQVAQYVDVLTISNVQDFKQSFIHTTKLGSDVLSIRAADLIQNSYYYHLAPVGAQKQLRDKYEFFMKLSNRVLNESLSNELRKAYEKNVKILQRHSQRIKIQTSNQETSP